jgi:peptide/nickel transport system permease protein
MALVVARRLLWALLTLAVTAVLVFGLTRVLQPELDPTRTAGAGLVHDLDRAVLHFDFGEACMVPGCPDVAELWRRGFAVDLYLLLGSLLIGAAAGILGGRYVGRHPRSRRARALEGFATLALCAPVYFIGLGLLLLFDGIFGVLPLPVFFSPQTYASPVDDPWDFVRTMLVPWLVLAGPVAGAALRITGAVVAEARDDPPVQLARALGLGERRVIGRYAAPAAYPALTGYLGVSAPVFVTNMVLTEYVFAVPGVFHWTKRALGQEDPLKWPPVPDMPMLAGLAMWAAVLIVLVVTISDVVQALLDPRVRSSSGRSPARRATGSS